MRIYDLAVVGGGYWGVATALRARESGKDVILFDDSDPLAGSRNASAICDPASYKSKVFRRFWPTGWTKDDLKESLNWLLGNGGELTEEVFLNQFEGRGIRPIRPKAIYLKSNEDFLRRFPATTAEVLGLERRGILWELRTRTGTFLARKICLALGYRTDAFLAKAGMPLLGVGRLYGRGIIVRGTPAYPVPICVMTRPYVKHTIRQWEDGYRVGDTAERGEVKEGVDPNLLAVTESVMGDQYEVLRSVNGFRPTADKFLVDKIAPGLAVATGGHRLGLGLAGLAAKKVLEALN
jgi:glycine/D-amino acid oxidase-like deaminating enzyme